MDEGVFIYLVIKLCVWWEIYYGVSYYELGVFSGRDYFGYRFFDKDEFEFNVNGYFGFKYKEIYYGS